MSGGPADEIDPATAAALLDRTRREVSGQLEISLSSLYAAWGVAWFVGAAPVVTAVVVGRAPRGISGASELQGATTAGRGRSGS